MSPLSNKEKEELEKNLIKFTDRLSSEAIFKVFLEIAKGENYVTKIARKLKKSKAIVSRQVRQLENARLVVLKGEGVKQTCYPNWEVFTYYWISTFSPALSIAPEMFSITKSTLKVNKKLPKWMSDLYLSKDEWKITEDKTINRKRISPESILEEKLLPIIHEIAPLIEKIVIISKPSDFIDAFFKISRSFAIGLPDFQELDIEIDKIENEKLRNLLRSLYSKEVRLWLKVTVFHDIYSANLVRNFVLKKLGLIEDN